MHTINSLFRFFTLHLGKPWRVTLLKDGWEDDGGTILYRKADPAALKKHYGDRMVQEWFVDSENDIFEVHIILL